MQDEGKAANKPRLLLQRICRLRRNVLRALRATFLYYAAQGAGDFAVDWGEVTGAARNEHRQNDNTRPSLPPTHPFLDILAVFVAKMGT